MAETKNNPNVNHRKRLRDRYMREGADSLETHELLELFLFDVLPRVNTNPIAHGLIDRFGSLDGVLRASAEELMTVRGVGVRTAEYIESAFREMREELENELRNRPTSSFERASNVLIWHRLSIKEPITVLSLDGEYKIKSICDLKEADVPQVCEVCKRACAVRVIIGAGKSTRLSVDSMRRELEECGVTLCDVILVDEYATESIME